MNPLLPVGSVSWDARGSRASGSPLAAVAAAPPRVWTTLTVSDWYGSGQRTVEVVSQTAVCSHTGLPPVPVPVPVRWVLIRDPQGKFVTQALLCTDRTATPEPIVAWFVLRWHLEVTFQEVHRHLGGETQRQWSELAIQRTTPTRLGLFSLVTLLAQQQLQRQAGPPDVIRQAAW